MAWPYGPQRLRTVADGCGRLQTVADGCGRKRSVERTHPHPDPQSETVTLATHSGKNDNMGKKHLKGLAVFTSMISYDFISRKVKGR